MEVPEFLVHVRLPACWISTLGFESQYFLFKKVMDNNYINKLLHFFPTDKKEMILDWLNFTPGTGELFDYSFLNWHIN